MDAVSAITSGNSLSNSVSSVMGNNDMQLKQEDFLKLLTTQLNLQSPLDPQDSSAMLEQMSQLSSISTNDSLQKTIELLQGSLAGSQSLQAANMVGRDVQVNSSTGLLQQGEGLSGGVVLPRAATDVTVMIKDASGKIVKQMALGNDDAGVLSFKWDGTGSDGKAAAPGLYTLEATANVDGTVTSLNATAKAKVESVTLNGTNGITLNLNGFGSVDLKDVLEIQ